MPTVKDYTGSLKLDGQGFFRGALGYRGAARGSEIRVTDIDEFPINVPPTQHMLFTLHRDMPGIIGKIGSLLGSFNVNIASMQVGRKIVRGDAVMVLSH
jgi:D-3-phosphoglycerate dehydrogenase